LLLSRDSAYRVRSAVTVAQITRTIRGIPVEVELDPADVMPTRCVVNLDTITTIPKSLLESHLCTLSPANLKEVEQALKFALDLP
jgi:mRNA interferase MazF